MSKPVKKLVFGKPPRPRVCKNCLALKEQVNRLLLVVQIMQEKRDRKEYEEYIAKGGRLRL